MKVVTCRNLPYPLLNSFSLRLDAAHGFSRNRFQSFYKKVVCCILSGVSCAALKVESVNTNEVNKQVRVKNYFPKIQKFFDKAILV